ncbi:hypothetical protein [Mucilaginibacter flavus]|uniref:hypothetical protein n=1 Tax=Mucilaginibacter flavus TaxID=931504 RepID=UPI0025B4CF17|nr:hypothetical protein [Mucilaginibacter flavus]MDN3579304.1 hypothetical protein [Mucilaginibacter flavus]
MTTVTIDILNDKALNLLKDLELLNVIRVRKEKTIGPTNTEDLVKKYKGAMTKQPIGDIEKQLEDLRTEWE